MVLPCNILFFFEAPVWLSDTIETILVIFILIAFLQMGFKKYLLEKCMKQEKWLPVVDDTGNIIGKVAQSVSLEEPGKFLHPLIRVIVVCNGMLFLKPRGKGCAFEKGKIDIPFEILLDFGKNIDDTLEERRRRLSDVKDKPDFIIKYRHENSEGKWLVLLYKIEISDIKQIYPADLSEGKLWTMKQINENLGESYFSNIFEEEFEMFSRILGDS